MRRVPETAPSRQSWKKPRQAKGNVDIMEKRMKVAAMPEAAPIRSRLRATCPFSRAFWRRRGVACSVWLACAMGQLAVLSCQRSVIGELLEACFINRSLKGPGLSRARCGHPYKHWALAPEESPRQQKRSSQ